MLVVLLSCWQDYRASVPGTHTVHHMLLLAVALQLCVCFHREQVQRSEESSPSVAASLRHQSMKQSASQHSFDSAILDGSLPDENLSVESDISENFVVIMDSGAGNTTRFPK